MTDRAYHEGWTAIAAAVGRSQRSCRTYAARPHDPLPVFRVGGIWRLNVADLDAWVERQRTAAPPPDDVAMLRAEVAALRAEVVRLTEVILRNAGVFTEGQIAAVLAVKAGNHAEVSHAP